MKSPRRAAPVEKPETAPSDALARSFFAIMMQHSTYMFRVFDGLDLSPVQARTLFFMSPTRPSTMSEVSQLSAFAPSNLTGIVDKLEGRGLVERRPSTEDRRSKVVRLTRAGVALRRRLLAAVIKPTPWMLALAPTQQATLLEILRMALATGGSSAAASAGTSSVGPAPVEVSPASALRRARKGLEARGR